MPKLYQTLEDLQRTVNAHYFVVAEQAAALVNTEPGSLSFDCELVVLVADIEDQRKAERALDARYAEMAAS